MGVQARQTRVRLALDEGDVVDPKRLAWRRKGVLPGDVYSLLVHADLLGVDLPETVKAILIAPPDWVKTPKQIWSEKTGRNKAKSDQGIIARIRRAAESESTARGLFNETYGTDCRRVVLEDPDHPHRRLALDGLDPRRGVLLNIKTPQRLWSETPAYVACELAYSRAVLRESGWEVEKSGVVMAENRRRRSTIHLLKDLEVDGLEESTLTVADAFWGWVERDAEPPLSLGDSLLRQDKEWETAAAYYQRAIDEFEQACRCKEDAENRLYALAENSAAGHQYGFGVEVTRTRRRGSIDYYRALQDVMGQRLGKADMERRFHAYRRPDQVIKAVADSRDKLRKIQSQQRHATSPARKR